MTPTPFAEGSVRLARYGYQGATMRLQRVVSTTMLSERHEITSDNGAG
jgi:hypothetical protein